jgi:hypothetical protein
MTNALVFSSVPLWEEHHAEVIELVWSLTEKGEQVYLVSCDSTLASCPANANHTKLKCYQCKNTTKYTEDKLLPENCIPIRLNLGKEKFNFKYRSINDLLSINYNNLPIGKLVASQIADDINGVYLDFTDDLINKRIDLLISNGIALYKRTFELIKDYQVDAVYTWNGRRPSDGPPIYAAKSIGIDYFTFISGGRVNNIHVAKSTSVQEIDVIEEKMQEYSQSINRNSIKMIGKKHFLTDIHKGINQIGFRVFNNLSVPPRQVNSSKPMLLVVTSSPTESIHMIEHQDFYGESPYDTIFSIINRPELFEKYNIVVRWHPGKIKAFTRDIEKINSIASQSNGIVHIKPEDRDDTYQLVKTASVVLSFGSTVGYVAALIGKPVILAGPMAYLFKESFYSAKTPNEVVDFLQSDLLPKLTDEIEYYGFYCANFGRKMNFVEMTYSDNGNLRVHLKSDKNKVLLTPNLTKLLNICKNIYKQIFSHHS